MGFVIDFERAKWITSITSMSHFLYVNTGILLHQIFPNISSIEIGRMISVFSSAICISLIYLLLCEFGKNKKIAFWLSVAFGLGFTFWRNAANLEVYTFNAIFALLFYLFLVKSLKTGTLKYYLFTGISLGIGFTSHIQNIMLLPILFAVPILFYKQHRFKTVLPLLISLLCLGIIFGVNHIQNQASNQVLSSDSKWVRETFTKDFSQYLKDILKAAGYLVYNVWFLIYFIFSGFLSLFHKDKKLSIILFVSILFNLGFATFYAATDNYNYFIISYIVLFIYIYQGILENKIRWLSFKYLKFGILLFPLFYFVSYKIADNTSFGKEFHESKAYKGGLKYYMLPWLNNNVGILEFTIRGKTAPEDISWMTQPANEYIERTKHKYSREELEKQ
jgi:hypothetical protein